MHVFRVIAIIAMAMNYAVPAAATTVEEELIRRVLAVTTKFQIGCGACKWQNPAPHIMEGIRQTSTISDLKLLESEAVVTGESAVQPLDDQVENYVVKNCASTIYPLDETLTIENRITDTVSVSGDSTVVNSGSLSIRVPFGKLGEFSADEKTSVTMHFENSKVTMEDNKSTKVIKLKDDVPPWTIFYYSAKRQKKMVNVPFSARVVVADALMSTPASQYWRTPTTIRISTELPSQDVRSFTITGLISSVAVSDVQISRTEVPVDKSNPDHCVK